LKKIILLIVAGLALYFIGGKVIDIAVKENWNGLSVFILVFIIPVLAVGSSFPASKKTKTNS